ncbi:hypothetical protein [Streptomyces carpaticus]|uniref:Uncharacterized protein n=1 Tax=Streptomyces carpaticus TaxID=285558 RepID=A0ABV4ZN27_9ACTN
MSITNPDSRLWSLVRDDSQSGFAEVGIEANGKSGVSIARGQSVTLPITFDPNKRDGTATATVRESTDDQGEQTLSVAKVQPGYSLRNLRPKEYVVPAGEEAELRWEHKESPAYTTACTLTYVTARGIRTEHPTGTSARLRLLQDTPVTLDATITPTAKPKTPLHAHLSTYVIVASPHVTAGGLTATGPTNLLAVLSNEGGPLPGFTRNDSYTTTIRRTLTAKTDGFLLATTEVPNRNATVTLSVHLENRGAKEGHLLQLRAKEEGSLLIPVPSGRTVTLKAELAQQSQPDQQLRYLVTLDWQPFGAGVLAVATPQGDGQGSSSEFESDASV